MKRILISFILVLSLTLLLFGQDTLRVSSKSFTEGMILGNMVMELLDEAGFKVDEKAEMSSFIIRSALLTKQIDLYVDYTGTAWVAYLENTTLIKNPEELFDAVNEMDLEKNNIRWINRIAFNNTYGLAVKREFAEKHNLTSLSDLSALLESGATNVLFGVNFDFYERPDGFFKMVDEYNMRVKKKQVKTMEIGMTYEALSRNSIQAAMVFATDGKLEKYNLTVLKDDKGFFPIYNPAISINADVLKKYPDIEQALLPLTKYLTPDIIRRLNYLVDAKGEEPEDVAHDYLKALGLID